MSDDEKPERVVRFWGASSKCYHKNAGTESEPTPACDDAASPRRYHLARREVLEPIYRPCENCFDLSIRSNGETERKTGTIEILEDMSPDALP